MFEICPCIQIKWGPASVTLGQRKGAQAGNIYNNRKTYALILISNRNFDVLWAWSLHWRLSYQWEACGSGRVGTKMNSSHKWGQYQDYTRVNVEQVQETKSMVREEGNNRRCRISYPSHLEGTCLNVKRDKWWRTLDILVTKRVKSRWRQTRWTWNTRWNWLKRCEMRT